MEAKESLNEQHISYVGMGTALRPRHHFTTERNNAEKTSWIAEAEQVYAITVYTELSPPLAFAVEGLLIDYLNSVKSKKLTNDVRSCVIGLSMPDADRLQYGRRLFEIAVEKVNKKHNVSIVSRDDLDAIPSSSCSTIDISDDDDSDCDISVIYSELIEQEAAVKKENTDSANADSQQPNPILGFNVRTSVKSEPPSEMSEIDIMQV